jgi:hypothetical protein
MIRSYKETSSAATDDVRKAFLDMLWGVFVRPSAACQVNVSAETVHKFRSIIANNNAKDIEELVSKL